MPDLPFFRYDPDLSPIEDIDWSKVTAVIINGVSYPVEYVETKKDEIRFQIPGADDIRVVS